MDKDNDDVIQQVLKSLMSSDNKTLADRLKTKKKKKPKVEDGEINVIEIGIHKLKPGSLAERLKRNQNNV